VTSNPDFNVTILFTHTTLFAIKAATIKNKQNKEKKEKQKKSEINHCKISQTQQDNTI